MLGLVGGHPVIGRLAADRRAPAPALIARRQLRRVRRLVLCSIAWAESPGDALQGSNRALLYLLVFVLMLSLPWTPEGALAALVTFALDRRHRSRS